MILIILDIYLDNRRMLHYKLDKNILKVKEKYSACKELFDSVIKLDLTGES